jgi:hypothetical protein
MASIQLQSSGGALTGATLQSLQTMTNWVFPTQGNVWFVNPSTGLDSNPGTAASPFKTLTQALAVAVAGQNDVVYLLAHSNTASATTDYQSATLTWNKDLVHLIGVNGGPMIGQRSRISNLSTAAALAPMFNLTANGCLIANIEFFQGTPASGTTSIAVQVTGQRNRVVNCQISGNGDLTGVTDVSGTRSLKISGSENIFQHCYIGLDTVIRATQVEEVEISAGARNIFEDCHFESYTSLSTFKSVAIATGCDRFMTFKNCMFTAVQNITSAVAPTGAIGITTMNGQVYMVNPYVYGYAQIVTADNAYVQVLGLNGLATGHLIGIAQGVDAA